MPIVLEECAPRERPGSPRRPHSQEPPTRGHNVHATCCATSATPTGGSPAAGIHMGVLLLHCVFVCRVITYDANSLCARGACLPRILGTHVPTLQARPTGRAMFALLLCVARWVPRWAWKGMACMFLFCLSLAGVHDIGSVLCTGDATDVVEASVDFTGRCHTGPLLSWRSSHHHLPRRAPFLFPPMPVPYSLPSVPKARGQDNHLACSGDSSDVQSVLTNFVGHWHGVKSLFM